MQQKPQDEATQHEVDSLLRERDKMLELIKESGWQPKTRLNAPPKNPVRLCAWSPD